MNGSAVERNLPDNLSQAGIIAWTKPLPGPGAATPIISKGRVFISSTDSQSDDLLALCFDAKDGRQLWRKKLTTAGKKFHRRNNMASPSPVTDGRYVYYLYGNGNLFSLDFEGQIQWSRNLVKEYGSFPLLFGFSSSPLLYDGKLYIAIQRRDKIENDKPLDSFLLAIDANSGKNVFKHQRKTDAVKEALEAYSTVIVFENNGHFEIGVVGSDHITGHDPKTGNELWRFGYNPDKETDWNTVPTLVRGDGIVYAAIGRGKQVIALKTDKTGLLTKNDVAWTFKGPTPDVSTPLYYKGNLYVLDGRKKHIVTCLDAKTGRQKWQGKLQGKGPWWASMTGSDDKIYCMSNEADVVVLTADGGEFKVLSRMSLNEKPSPASIAISNGRLYIRTAKNLYCIGD